jgi:hypothetical protein
VDDRRPNPRKEITKKLLPESYSPNPTENTQRGLLWMKGGPIQERREQKRCFQDDKDDKLYMHPIQPRTEMTAVDDRRPQLKKEENN